jgi:hypothetical protein
MAERAVTAIISRGQITERPDAPRRLPLRGVKLFSPIGQNLHEFNPSCIFAECFDDQRRSLTGENLKQ